MLKAGQRNENEMREWWDGKVNMLAREPFNHSKPLVGISGVRTSLTAGCSMHGG
jgi:hypothetical protein